MSLADALAKAAASQTKVNAQTFTTKDNSDTTTDFVTTYKKDKYNNDATVIAYTQFEMATTDTIGSYSNLPETLLKLSDSGSYKNMTRVALVAIEGEEVSNVYGYSYQTSAFGGMELIQQAYAISQAGTSISAVTPVNFVDKTVGSAYSFTFGAIIDSTSYGSYSVHFTLGDEGEMKEGGLTMTTYDSYSKNDTTGVVTPGDNVMNKMFYTFTQTVGTRIRDETIDFAKYFFTTWTPAFYTGIVQVDDLATMKVGTSYTLKLLNGEEPDASIKYDAPTITVTAGDADGISAQASLWSGTIDVSATKAGTYTLHIKTINFEDDVTVTFVIPDVENVSVYNCLYRSTINGSGYGIEMISDVLTSYLDDPLILRPTFSPTAAAQDFTFAVMDTSSNPITTVTGEKTTVSSTFGETWNVVKFTSTVAQTVVIRISSSSNSDVYQQVAVTFVARPDLADFLNGHSFIYRDPSTKVLTYDMSFSSITKGASDYSGTITLADKTSTSGANEVCTFTATYDAAKLTYTLAATKTSGTLDLIASVVINRYFECAVIDANTNETDYVLKTVRNLACGNYQAVVSGVTYVVLLDAATGQSSSHNDDYSIYSSTEFNWMIDGTATTNGYKVSFVNDAYTMADQLFIDFSGDSYISADYQTLTIPLKTSSGDVATAFAFTALVD